MCPESLGGQLLQGHEKLDGLSQRILRPLQFVRDELVLLWRVQLLLVGLALGLVVQLLSRLLLLLLLLLLLRLPLRLLLLVAQLLQLGGVNVF